MRFSWLVLLATLAMIGGCAHGPSRPSTAAERTPSPDSVTRDNPAGDAEAQVDAALTRLLEQPDAYRYDRFRTLKVRLMDRDIWKRVRFWGHPTRAAYRYGKEGYAVAVVAYFDAEGDDSPRSCLERFVRDAEGTAESFDVAIGPRRRELRKHYRGPESVDWVEHERLAKKRRAERQKHVAELRRKARTRRPRLKMRRDQLRALRKGRAPAKGARPPLPKVVSQPPVDDKGAPMKLGPPPGPAPLAPGSGIRPTAAPSSRATAANPTGSAHPAAPPSSASPAAPPSSASLAAAASAVPSGVATRATKRPKRLVKHFHKLRALAKQAQRKGAWRRHKRPRRQEPARYWKWRERRFGMADMPVIRLSGQFDTVLVQDRYLAAVVAYQSWPDTCLVQGLAVRVGSDETLTQKVIDRWVKDLANKLVWFHNLRETPPFENR